MSIIGETPVARAARYDVAQQEAIARLIEANQNLRVEMRKLLEGPFVVASHDEAITMLNTVADRLAAVERWFENQREPGFSVARAATNTAGEHALTAHRLLKRAYGR